jgi:threonine dehydrogenase-like Zn-dependent dehydrogenase
LWDVTKQMTGLYPDRTTVLREVIQACRKGGTVSLPGVYAGYIDKMPLGTAFGKGLTFKMGQTHVHRYMRPLLQEIRAGRIDPSTIISHRVQLDDAPEAYQMFRDKESRCIKVVMKP